MIELRVAIPSIEKTQITTKVLMNKRIVATIKNTSYSLYEMWL